MFLKNISKEEQLTMTINGKKVIKPGEVFEICKTKGEALKRGYKSLFEEVETMEAVKKEKSEKTEKKEKTLKSK